MHSKKTLFDLAAEITKEYARGGSSAVYPDVVFEKIFASLKTIAESEGILQH